jgi:hypothetical protein
MVGRGGVLELFRAIGGIPLRYVSLAAQMKSVLVLVERGYAVLEAGRTQLGLGLTQGSRFHHHKRG